MSRTLRYQISDWNQITECLSNNSKNLYLTLSKHLDKNVLRDLVIQVNHTNYGVLFAAIIKGTGTLLSTRTETGEQLPFFTTDQILTELQRFGFYITYDVKSNLPGDVISYLATIDNLGYDKITKIGVKVRPSIVDMYTIVMKSTEHNDDILAFGTVISKDKFNEKLAANTVVNVTNECEGQWDWVTYIANISDILDENIDPRDHFETKTNVKTEDFHPYAPTFNEELESDIEIELVDPADLVPEGYTLYISPEPEEDDG